MSPIIRVGRKFNRVLDDLTTQTKVLLIESGVKRKKATMSGITDNIAEFLEKLHFKPEKVEVFPKQKRGVNVVFVAQLMDEKNERKHFWKKKK